MSVLAANLKHLYQRRGLWLIYLFLGFIVFASIEAPLDRPGPDKGLYIGFLVAAAFVGFLAAALTVDVLTKPFSYCLPGHRKTVRKFILWIGVAISVLGALIFLMYPGLYLWQLILVLCSAFFANVIFYWLGVGLAFVTRNSAAIVGFWPLVIFGGKFFDLHIILESAIVGNPFRVISVGFLSTVVAWFWLGNPALARRYCDVLWIGLLDAWNRDKIQKYRKARAVIKWAKLKTHPNPWVERFFLGRTDECDYVGPGRYIWGGLYTTFGIALSQLKAALPHVFAALLMLYFLCYMGPVAPFMLFFMPGFMVVHIRLPVYSSMLISGGRSERFFTVLTLVATIAVLITTAATVIAVLSEPLAAIMPDITLRGSTFTFHAMSIKPFFVPLLMIPIGFTIQLIFYRRPIFIVLLYMLFFMLLFSTGFFWRRHLSAMINPISFIASLLVLSWSIFVLVLHHICMKWCLVGQARG